MIVRITIVTNTDKAMADTKDCKDWIVRYYDKKDKLINSQIIKDRTEHEAEHEAIADMPYECEDWTMVEKN